MTEGKNKGSSGEFRLGSGRAVNFPSAETPFVQSGPHDVDHAIRIPARAEP
jgi:hypothetical protein